MLGSMSPSFQSRSNNQSAASALRLIFSVCSVVILGSTCHGTVQWTARRLAGIALDPT